MFFSPLLITPFLHKLYLGARLAAEVGAAQAELAALTAMVREQQQMQEQDKNRKLNHP